MSTLSRLVFAVGAGVAASCWFTFKTFCEKNGSVFSFTSGDRVVEKADSLFEALNVLKISALFRGDVSRNSCADLLGDMALLVFRCGEGELCLFRSKVLKGELLLLD